MNHDSQRALVLSQEDLTDEEARIVEAHLAQCPGCRELLADLRRVETASDQLASLPAVAADSLYQLDPSEERAERESRQALLTKLDAETGVGGKR
jgi:anti-sigma factor RsiW